MLSEAFVARLEGVRANGSGWQARCPAHEDHAPSLSVATGEDGRILLHCHAGCSASAIVTAMGLTMRDLMPEGSPKASSTPRRVVATYTYTDEHGALLYEVVRYRPKDFRQRRPDGNGGYVWNLGDARRVLYRLHDLHTCRPPAVFLVEGERDVQSIVAADEALAATCNSGGAGNWTDDHTRQLVASGVQRVCIIQDADRPGRDHAESVAARCMAAGIEARIVDLLPFWPAVIAGEIRVPVEPQPVPAAKSAELKGADVTDWLEAGGTAADLRRLAKQARVWMPAPTQVVAAPVPAPEAKRSVSLTRASAITVRPVRWLYRDRMAMATFGLLGGREGIGKSIVAAEITAAITTGRLDGELRGSPRDVVMVTTEDSKEHTIVPRLMAAGADLERVHFLTVKTPAGETDLVLPEDVADLERVIREVCAALVWFDPLLSRLDARLDSHKDQQTRQALEPLAKVAESTGACIVGLIHVNKTSTVDPLTMLMASRAFAAVARFVLFAMVDPDDETRRLLGLAKTNLGRLDVPTLGYQVVPHHVASTAEGEVWTGRLEWLGEAQSSIREALQTTTPPEDRSAVSEAGDWLLDYLAAAGGSAESALVKSAGKKAGFNDQQLRRARERRKVRTVSGGFPRTTKWLSPAQSWQGRPTAPTTDTTATTATTGDAFDESTTTTNPPVVSVAAVAGEPARDAATGPTSEGTGDAELL